MYQRYSLWECYWCTQFCHSMLQGRPIFWQFIVFEKMKTIFFNSVFFFAWFFVHDFIHVQERTLLEKLLLRKYYLIIVLSFLCFLYAFSHFLVSSFVALSAIIFGSLTWRCEKPLLILSTSFLGSFLVICGM